MTADLWGFASVATICFITVTSIMLGARAGLFVQTIAAFVICLLSFMASILILPPDFGGGVLLLIGTGLGLGLGALVEVVGKAGGENVFVLPPAFSAAGILLLAAATVHSPDMAHSPAAAFLAGAASSWVIGRAMAQLLQGWRRILPVPQTRQGRMLTAVTAIAASCSVAYGLTGTGIIGYVTACGFVFLFGLLLGAERGARQGRQLTGLVGWTATATACLGIATANVAPMLLGGFIAAVLLGRLLPQR